VHGKASLEADLTVAGESQLETLKVTEDALSIGSEIRIYTKSNVVNQRRCLESFFIKMSTGTPCNDGVECTTSGMCKFNDSADANGMRGKCEPLLSIKCEHDSGSANQFCRDQYLSACFQPRVGDPKQDRDCDVDRIFKKVGNLVCSSTSNMCEIIE
jgi:hypothetical protein